MAHANFTGSQKAAILLLSFGEEISAEIFKHLNEFEVKRIGTAMSRIGRLEQDIVDEVITEFYLTLQKTRSFVYGSSEYAKKVIGTALKGTATGDEIIEELALTSSNLDSLELIDPRTLAGFIRHEHPQTIALILAHLPPNKFGETLRLLPETLHTEILLRVCNLDAVAPEFIDEIEDVLRQEVQAMGSITNEKLGGAEALADMFNVLDKNTEAEWMEKIEERDPDLAEEIRQLMFVFDDLGNLDAKSIQEVIKAVPNDKWKLALKAASEGVKQLVFANMSERASEMLREDMEAMGATKVSDVEATQFEILQITRKLEDEGKIIIATGGEAAYV